jgi:hypothetical protein
MDLNGPLKGLSKSSLSGMYVGMENNQEKNL